MLRNNKLRSLVSTFRNGDRSPELCEKLVAEAEQVLETLDAFHYDNIDNKDVAEDTFAWLREKGFRAFCWNEDMIFVYLPGILIVYSPEYLNCGVGVGNWSFTVQEDHCDVGCEGDICCDDDDHAEFKGGWLLQWEDDLDAFRKQVLHVIEQAERELEAGRNGFRKVLG